MHAVRAIDAENEDKKRHERPFGAFMADFVIIFSAYNGAHCIRDVMMAPGNPSVLDVCTMSYIHLARRITFPSARTLLYTA